MCKLVPGILQEVVSPDLSSYTGLYSQSFRPGGVVELAASHETLHYPTLPYSIPYSTLPYPTLPYPALPCPALPYSTLPDPTLPNPTLHYLTLLCPCYG